MLHLDALRCSAGTSNVVCKLGQFNGVCDGEGRGPLLRRQDTKVAGGNSTMLGLSDEVLSAIYALIVAVVIRVLPPIPVLSSVYV